MAGSPLNETSEDPSGTCQAGDLPGWFADAEARASEISSQTRGSTRANHSVYVVLLRDEADDLWGLYVGLTGLKPEKRFLRHKAGIQSGKKRVMRFGVTLAPSLFAHLNPCEYEEAVQLEKSLIKVFQDAGVPWVTGS